MTAPRVPHHAKATIAYVLCAAACASVPPASHTVAGPDRGLAAVFDRNRCTAAAKRVVKVDLTGDGIANMRAFYGAVAEGDEDVLLCRTVDLNADGQGDLWIHYAADDTVVEEIDLDFDGVVDVTTLRRGGQIIAQELDTRGDGAPDIWKYFSAGILTELRKDSTGDGRADIWEHYQAGQLQRIGYDATGDGTVDRWERAAGPSPKHKTEARPPEADASVSEEDG